MEKLTKKHAFGKTGLNVPPILFGTSCLGNLYQAPPFETKLAIVEEFFQWVDSPVVLDSAGKYGAGLALEVIGDCLREAGIAPDQIVISNKLGWRRVPLTTPEPQFEPGAWVDLKYDAEQDISYKGIIRCWEQGLELLGGDYVTDVVSVHDPDEYLSAAKDDLDRGKRWEDLLGAYQALHELKRDGKVKAIGVGVKDWRVIKDLHAEVELDWVMLACSYTIMTHPEDLMNFIKELNEAGVAIINSAVFNAGFLTGGKYFDYRVPSLENPDDKHLFEWRDKFFELCQQFSLIPAEVCVQFGMTAPGVIGVALNTSKPERVKQNVAAVQAEIPNDFWKAMKQAGLIRNDYLYC